MHKDCGDAEHIWDEGYWTKYYEEVQDFDWLVPYDRLRPIFLLNRKHIRKCRRLLHVGCGTSDFSTKWFYDAALWADEDRQLTNLDFSRHCIKLLQSKWLEQYPGENRVAFATANALDMRHFGEQQWDLVLDKFALDAIAARDAANGARPDDAARSPVCCPPAAFSS
mmetsp:Transcript_77451/g.206820  ORF Transcript_77451/g.206820 Transcript_77451/m.206820 type:complete len:167 (+) Transcript_77451:72-572(+)